jgi:ABC-type multidrug transport system fused ATPase/permease subunit
VCLGLKLVYCIQTIPILSCIITFICFVGVGYELNDALAFAALALFYVLRLPLLIYPQLLAGVADGQVSIKRIQEMLLSEEITSEPERLSSDADSSNSVVVKDAMFVWEKTADDKATDLTESVTPFGLHNVNLSIKKGQLIAIVGSVGSGKSSLLNALIGEMRRAEGSVMFYGSTAYCAQQAWIQNMTVRDNILFGLPFEETRYDRVIDACALASDLAMLPGKANMIVVEICTDLLSNCQPAI